MRLDLLFAHCADLGLNVEWDDLGGHRRGEYRDDDLLIVINSRLTRAQATATLAHEFGHAVFADRCTTPANERRAWELGASLIITCCDFASAEGRAGSHTGALAHELEVTPKLIDAWRRWHNRQCARPERRCSQIAGDFW